MASLPDYVASAQSVPQEKRAPWYKTIAPTYAGIMLWFVFWQSIVEAKTPGGALSQGVVVALMGLILAACICYFLFYLVPGMLGMKTGLPLYVVGTSTYGVAGGLIMPGLVMGLLQFGWLAVNAAGVARLLCMSLDIGLQADGITPQVPGAYHGAIAALFAILAAFMGLKGIQYVARVATYLPLIPLAVLVILLAKTAGGLGSFSADKIAAPPASGAGLSVIGVIGLLTAYVVGFFATAGAAGADIASSARDENDVRRGGVMGIGLATVIAGGLAILVVAGAYGGDLVPDKLAGQLNPLTLMKGGLLSEKAANVIMILLAIAAFPAGCFSAFIAANSFKTTMPKVNPFISVGLGTAVAILLAVTGVADRVVDVFFVIGASFGPVCGAMLADYLLAGRRWAGPCAGFNPAGWISWIVGFAVGAFGLVVRNISSLAQYQDLVPVPPITAFIVGFVLYFVLAKLGLESKTLEHPAARG